MWYDVYEGKADAGEMLLQYGGQPDAASTLTF
jgi:hypothetical protein